MNTKPIQPKLSAVLFCLAFLLGGPGPLPAQQDQASPLDLVVKITGIQETLDLIDDLAGMEPGQSPSAQLKAMLQGTDWIDPARSIVIGLEFVAGQGQPKASLLMPFREANEGFQSAFNALPGPDYYLMSLPPGPGQDISEATEEALVTAATSESKGVLSMEMALSKLMSAADAQIRAGLGNLDNITPPEGTQKFGLTPQDIKQAAVKMLDTAGQVELFTIGLDLDEDRFATSFELQAGPETELADLFVEGGKTSLLASFKPTHQINFRYRSFDMAALMEFINDCFGDLYQKMGIDFSEIAAMCEGFTGEMAGGLSFGKEGIAMEVISVLKDTEATAAPDFLETVYVPWMAKYSQDLAAMLEQQTGTKMESFYATTPESTVAGYKVIGMKTQLPFPQGPQMQGADETLAWTAYEMRMTTVGNLLLVADTDEGIARLIDVAKTVKEEPAEGPLMTMDMDMGGYLVFLAQMMPQNAPPLPKLGKMVVDFDVKAGRASGSFAIMTEDIRTVIAHFKNMVQPAPVTEGTEAPAESVGPKAGVKEKPPEPPKEDPSTQQLHKGALLATYGNDKAAIAYFQRAIELDPENSGAYFQRGISLGELGQYEEAISSIDKAIALGHREGLYLYGRGRVYLLSGDEASALEDFKAAAALGNREAKEYLESTLHARR